MEDKISLFNYILETFENDDLKQFAIDRLKNASFYWWSVPASSSGKYHPYSSLGEGGLVRHTLSVVKILNYMLEVESIANQFTSRERDILRVAAICHDMMKSGSQLDYDQNPQTKFNHPLLEANDIYNGGMLDEQERRLCARIIASHMGQWNTSSQQPDVVLPKPKDKYQVIVHLADYIASRKEVTIDLGSANRPKEDVSDIDINTWQVPFGKHSGKTIPEIAKEDPSYIRWAKENMNKEPARTLFRNFQE